jgi:hypothetical protein
MYGTPAHLVIGFHACDQAVGEQVLAGKAHLKPSGNAYDWLGSGRYFWEGDLARAVEFGEMRAKRMRPPGIRWPFVLGAIIDLGHCLNLLESENLRLLRDGYDRLSRFFATAGTKMPQNKPLHGSRDLLLRYLDCAVIEAVHRLREEEKQPPYDSIRGVFWEGEELYPQAGFRSHNHIQICVRNPNCIKGYFRPLKPSPDYPLPSRIRKP